MKPRLLDLFCGAGGAAMGYHRAGFEVVGVDVKPQPHYPFEFVQKDAIEYLVDDVWDGYRGGFQAIHASPPCQPWTAYNRRSDHVKHHPELVDEVLGLLFPLDVPWVVENVSGSPLPRPFRLCGSSFGLDIRRHRYFESSLSLLPPPCDHGWQTPRYPQATNRTNKRSTVEVGVWRIPLAEQKRAMGVDWNVTLEELSEMVPPAYTEWIGRQLLAAIGERAA